MNRKMTRKRLLIFVAVSFLLTWVPSIVYGACGYGYDTGAMEFIMWYGMLCPAIAVLFTRYVTKEGFAMTGKGSLMLGIDLSGRKWIWYVLAFLMPMLSYDLGDIFLCLISPECFYPGGPAELGVSGLTVLMYPLFGIMMAVFGSCGALGEEIGWRGYMMPKLEELFGTSRAIIIGGVIWGVWHFPEICQGHNFGTGYWGEPWSGFFVFTVTTIVMGITLTYLTKKTGSVWPAAFMHATNNTGARIMGFFLGEHMLEMDKILIALIQLLGIIVVTAVFVRIVRKS